MKNIVIRFSWFILFILSFFFFTRMVFAGEKIENFQVEARINKDSSVDVIEIIEYNFSVSVLVYQNYYGCSVNKPN